MTLVENLLSGNLDEAREQIEERIEQILEQKLNVLREKIVDDLKLNEVRNIQKMGRTKLIRVRVRGGKVQRGKKLSTIPGYTIRGGKVVRMSPLERRRRKMGARKAKTKMRGKMSTILRKRKMSLRKRSTMGLR